MFQTLIITELTENRKALVSHSSHIIPGVVEVKGPVCLSGPGLGIITVWTLDLMLNNGGRDNCKLQSKLAF